jgi:hypothetical protein
MLLLVNGAMDATDGAVEAWLAEDLGAVSATLSTLGPEAGKVR